jgi:hypothetical protein
MGLHQHIGIAPSPAIMAILSRFDRPTLEAFLTVAVDLLDTFDPDPEAEPVTWPNDPSAAFKSNLPDDCEAVGDERDVAWIEWERMAPVKRKHANHAGSDNEDDEEDDLDTCLTADDIGSARTPWHCSDGLPGDSLDAEDGHDREEVDESEREQMVDDVPMLPVFSAEHNMFTDQRVPLGIGNLQSSFLTNGKSVRSADSGNEHRSEGWQRKPGAPV